MMLMVIVALSSDYSHDHDDHVNFVDHFPDSHVDC